MLELDALDGHNIHVRQVAWVGYNDGPRHLYKRHSLADPWTRASGNNREVEYATFQDLRRKGYSLVNSDGSPILDEQGQVVGDKPLPPAKSTLSMEAIQAALDKALTLDLTTVPNGESPITRLLTLEDRISLIRFNEALSGLPRETLVGYALQIAVRVQGHTPLLLIDGIVTPAWMQDCMTMGNPALLGHLIVSLARADKREILTLIHKLLPEVVRLDSLHHVPSEGTPREPDFGGVSREPG
ncbi:hypothetical protein [Microcoleus phage My-WqHQDG]|nr:hypothetical protein [Microcoleus phage My-WqHQDG]